MKKCYAVCDFLSDENKRQIAEAAARNGYSVEFYNDGDEAGDKISDGEVIYCDSSALVTRMPDLKWCHSAFAGAEKFIRTGVFDSGEIIFTNSSGAYGLTISEHIIMVTLMLLRRMPDYLKIIESRGWVQDLSVRSIQGSNVVIIGTGDIGRNTAARFKALGAKRVTGLNRSGRPQEGFDCVRRMDEYEQVITQEGKLDVLVLCVPGTPETTGLLSRERIEMLSSETYVINVGRGTVVDQEALLEALETGRIAGAALDVMYPEPLPADHPLWTAKNCIITPHISGDMGMQHTVDLTVQFFCENFDRFTHGEELLHRVNITAGY